MSERQWMASAPGIAHMGPYASDIEAWRAVRGHDGLPVPGAGCGRSPTMTCC